MIAADGPISIAAYMGMCAEHYYATRMALGADGDFITAPEISQLFGEMVGLALADAWLRAGQPEVIFAELGPGRGTLAADALRTMAQFGLTPPVHFVETSPLLMHAQLGAVPGAVHHDDIAALPRDRPLIAVANEFFDALPVQQFIAADDGWHERLIALDGGALVARPASAIAAAPFLPPSRNYPTGAVLEVSAAARAAMAAVASRIAARGGLILVFDYGYAGPAAGDTVQAVRAHAPVDWLTRPGECDLTAHVDFTALADAAFDAGALIMGPVDQGVWLHRLGIGPRCAALAAANPDQADALTAGAARLTAPDQMGQLFQVLAAHGPNWPVPEGFMG